ncbi:MAG: DoxX family protein [Dehalococcoidales bacterium]|nr:MAG: DoxX family protein [Dehalococcoidales bacterium]
MLRYRYWISLGASVLLGLVFLTAGVGKLLGEGAFLLQVSTLVLNPAVASAIAAILPWVEIVLGTLLLTGIATRIAAGTSALLIASFIYYNGWMISQGFGFEPCGCLGIMERLLGDELSTTQSLYIDIGLLVLALGACFCFPGRLLSIRPWFWNRGSMRDSPPGNNNRKDSAVNGDIKGI